MSTNDREVITHEEGIADGIREGFLEKKMKVPFCLILIQAI